MASDQSPTANKTILTVALLSVFILVSLKFILTSYYVDMTEAKAKELSSTARDLIALRAAQNKDLEQSGTPIAVAMKNLASSGRENAPAVVAPVQAAANETGPLAGWNNLKREVADFVVLVDASAASDSDGGAMVVGDGGVLVVGDGGAINGATNGAVHAATTPAADAGVVATGAPRDAGAKNTASPTHSADTTGHPGH